MGRFTVAVVAFVVLLAAPCIGNAGTITYSIQNYPADQNGATLSGTITTDGAIGNLASSDILSWSWTITPAGGTPVTVTSSVAGLYNKLDGSVVASPIEITIASPAAGSGDNYLDLGAGSDFGLDYYRTSEGAPSTTSMLE